MFECCGCCLRAAEKRLFEKRVFLYEVDAVAKRTEDLFVDDCDKIRYAVVLGNRGPIQGLYVLLFSASVLGPSPNAMSGS